MADQPTKQAKCVTCGKDITIGKFASVKTAFCDEHAPKKGDKPKPTGRLGGPVSEAPIPIPTSPAPVVGGTAVAGPIISPAPAQQTTPPEPVAMQNKVLDGVKEAFLLFVGKPPKKDKDAAIAAGFLVSQYNVIYKKLPDGSLVTLVEMGGQCLGVAHSVNNVTVPVFDQSQLTLFKPEVQQVVIELAKLVA